MQLRFLSSLPCAVHVESDGASSHFAGKRSTSMNFCTLPVGVRGRGWYRKWIVPGILNPASRARQWFVTLSAFSESPSPRPDNQHSDPLAQHLAGETEHRAIRDARRCQQDFLDFRCVHVLRAGDDHVLQPSLDVDKSILARRTEVAGMNEAAAECFRRLFRLIEIAGACRRRAPDNFADLARRCDGPVRPLNAHFRRREAVLGSKSSSRVRLMDIGRSSFNRAHSPFDLKTAVDPREVVGFCKFARSGCISPVRAGGTRRRRPLRNT
jgi:hypothetical protein